MGFKEVCKEILEELKKRDITDQHKFNRLKLEVLQRHKLYEIPTNVDIASVTSDRDREKYKKLLTIKPVRESSGVSVIAIMTKPIKCPHGKCIYCPGGPGSVFGDMPQSYTGKEPATRRAIRNNYDPYLQVSNRLEQYMAMNKTPDKIELIIMGGTFPNFPKHYQDNFIKYSFSSMNDLSKLFFKNNKFNSKKFIDFFELPGDIEDPNRTKKIHNKLLKLKKKVDLGKEHLKNEKAKLRCIAMCIETKPDCCKKPHINNMLRLGATRVELGVQTVYDEILKKVNRGHNIQDTIEATQLMKDSFLKVGYHMMPGLPGVTKKMDEESLKEIIINPNFKPDALKIYPTMVMRGTGLHGLWKSGKYTPMKTEQAAEMISEFKRIVPEYMRIMRVQRDIPTFMTEDGVDRTNLRQYIDKKTIQKGIKCRCIRCREPRDKKIDMRNVKINVKEYEASKGKEIFISADDEKNDLLLGFCRLRIPYKPFRKEITKKSAGIRELHVYGESVEIGKKGKSIQHRGLGKKLMRKAELIAKKDYGINKMLVISGIGARDYYRKLGYKKEKVYMVKRI